MDCFNQCCWFLWVSLPMGSFIAKFHHNQYYPYPDQRRKGGLTPLPAYCMPGTVLSVRYVHFILWGFVGRCLHATWQSCHLKACVLSNTPHVITSAKLTERGSNSKPYPHGEVTALAHFFSVETQLWFSCFFPGFVPNIGYFWSSDEEIKVYGYKN